MNVYVLTSMDMDQDHVRVFKSLNKCIEQLIDDAYEFCVFLEKEEVLTEAKDRDKSNYVYTYITPEGCGYTAEIRRVTLE